jgi:bla regulator protein blaR1
MTTLAAALVFAVNHLWQSTIVAAVAVLLARPLRTNSARVRYALWMVASVKFLIPFAVLTALGRIVAPAAPPIAIAPRIAQVVDAATPFAWDDVFIASASASPHVVATVLPFLVVLVWAAGGVSVAARWTIRWRHAAGIARRATAMESGREIERLRRVQALAGVGVPIALRLTRESLEPAVFGLRRVVLLWPHDIGRHLTDAQIDSILAHEIAHVRRRDNLAAPIHMLVEALCWFHPVVWWIGARLVDEREHACDEAVLRLGHARGEYAESVLTTCRLCVEAPLPCISGVTGSDLARRIESIMTIESAALTTGKKYALGALAAIAVAGPVALGAVHASGRRAGQPQRADMSFEVASIKPNTSGDLRTSLQASPGGRFTATNLPLRALVLYAWQRQMFEVAGGPDWFTSDRFDVLAKAEQNAAPVGEIRGMLRTLLKERFKLRVHEETRELPLYELQLARTDGRFGPRLRKSAANCDGVEPQGRPIDPGTPPTCGFVGPAPGTVVSSGKGSMAFRGVTMANFARFWGPALRRMVVDRTGLTGYFDGEFDPTAEFGPPPPPPGVPDPWDRASFPTVFTVLREQLGLKLESSKGPVNVLVIDYAEKPTPN